MTEDKRAILIDNTARNIGGVTKNIKYRHAAHCYLADKEYGTRLAKALDLCMNKVEELSKLGHKELNYATRQGELE